WAGGRVDAPVADTAPFSATNSALDTTKRTSKARRHSTPRLLSTPALKRNIVSPLHIFRTFSLCARQTPRWPKGARLDSGELGQPVEEAPSYITSFRNSASSSVFT